MIIGFTGTKRGMTMNQLEAVAKIFLAATGVEGVEMVELHHGDCVGADRQAHHIFEATIKPRLPFSKIHVHPPNDSSRRAFVRDANVVHPMRSYLARDRDIVDAADVLIAAPRSLEEEMRSGTWYTVRYTRKMKKPIIIIAPNGEERKEGWNQPGLW